MNVREKIEFAFNRYYYEHHDQKLLYEDLEVIFQKAMEEGYYLAVDHLKYLAKDISSKEDLIRTLEEMESKT